MFHVLCFMEIIFILYENWTQFHSLIEMYLYVFVFVTIFISSFAFQSDTVSVVKYVCIFGKVWIHARPLL